MGIASIGQQLGQADRSQVDFMAHWREDMRLLYRLHGVQCGQACIWFLWTAGGPSQGDSLHHGTAPARLHSRAR